MPGHALVTLSHSDLVEFLHHYGLESSFDFMQQCLVVRQLGSRVYVNGAPENAPAPDQGTWRTRPPML